VVVGLQTDTDGPMALVIQPPSDVILKRVNRS